MCVKMLTKETKTVRDMNAWKVFRVTKRGNLRSLYRPRHRISQDESSATGRDLLYRKGKLKTSPFGKTEGIYCHLELKNAYNESADKTLDVTTVRHVVIPKGTRIRLGWGIHGMCILAEKIIPGGIPG